MVNRKPFPLRYERGSTPLAFRKKTGPAVSPNGVTSFPYRGARILTQLCVHLATGELKPFECIIDTGAGISLFPRKVWTSCVDAIVWLEPNDEVTRQATDVKGISDPRLVARWGLVTVSLRNAPSGKTSRVDETSAFEILGRFMETATTFDRVVFGLCGNAMDRWRGLSVDFSSRDAWLV